MGILLVLVLTIYIPIGNEIAKTAPLSILQLLCAIALSKDIIKEDIKVHGHDIIKKGVFTSFFT